MSVSPNTHWTTDEQLLAKYVLGQLDARRAADLEKHLQVCAPCRDAVSAERQLAAGVRRAGRDALKRRLAGRIERKGTGSNWYRVAGVAAAFVILLTIGIVNNWFFSGESKLADSRLKSDSIAPKAESTPQQLVPEPGALEKKPLADFSKPSVTDREQAETKGAGGRRDEFDRKRQNEGGEKRDITNVPVPGVTGNILSKDDQMVAAAAQPEGIWVEGRVVDEAENVRAAGKAMDKISEDNRGNAPKEKKESAAQMLLSARSRAPATEGPPVVVTQRPASELPRNQVQARQTYSQVQTLVRSDATGLSMVLYTDSLLNRNDLSRARLQTISEDSIILQVGGQRIGYRLPPGLTEQMAKQLQKAK